MPVGFVGSPPPGLRKCASTKHFRPKNTDTRPNKLSREPYSLLVQRDAAAKIKGTPGKFEPPPGRISMDGPGSPTKAPDSHDMQRGGPYLRKEPEFPSWVAYYDPDRVRSELGRPHTAHVANLNAFIGRGGAACSLARGKKPRAEPTILRNESTKLRFSAPSNFRNLYRRRDMPFEPMTDQHGRKFLNWKGGRLSADVNGVGSHIKLGDDIVQGGKTIRLQKLATSQHVACLPILFEGLIEAEEPFTFFVDQGVEDLCKEAGNMIQTVIPQCIGPLRTALNTRDHLTIYRVLNHIQYLCQKCPGAGLALVPFYSKLLPVLNIFATNRNYFGGSDRLPVIQTHIDDTLHIMAEYGGSHAARIIKNRIPTFEHN